MAARMTELLTVVIQAMPGRPALQKTLASIRESDLPEPTILYQPPDLTPVEFFLSVLDWMAAAPTELVLRLEDDVLVNRHILHNIQTWEAVHDPRFGLGWLYDPGGSTRTVHDVMYHRASEDRWHSGPLHGAQAVLAWTRDMPTVRRQAGEYTAVHGLVFDVALAAPLPLLGKAVCIHAPSLAEHQFGQSTLGNYQHYIYDTSNGTFDLDWRRSK